MCAKFSLLPVLPVCVRVFFFFFCNSETYSFIEWQGDLFIYWMTVIHLSSDRVTPIHLLSMKDVGTTKTQTLWSLKPKCYYLANSWLGRSKVLWYTSITFSNIVNLCIKYGSPCAIPWQYSDYYKGLIFEHFCIEKNNNFITNDSVGNKVKCQCSM